MTPTIPAVPATTPSLMTAEEFVRSHGDESGVELVDGTIVRYPMPGAEHGEVCSKANYYLMNYVFEKRNGRVLGNDTFIRTKPGTYRGADVCFLSYERLPKEQPSPKGPLEVAPELVIEVRSPSNRLGDIQIKVGEYMNAGVKVVVILDPAIDAATVYLADEDIPQRFSNGDELNLGGLLPGFAVPVRNFFD